MSLIKANWSMKSHRCAHNARRGGFGGGAGSGGSTTDSSPWGGQQPYLTDVFNSAQSQYQGYTPQYYGAQGTSLNGQNISGQSTVTPFNSDETNAIGGIENTGLNGTQQMGQAANATSNILNTNPANNPYYQQMANTVLSTEVPGLESQFTQGNSVNNPAMAYATTQGATNALGNTMFQNYNQGVSNQLNAAGTAQNLFNTQLGGQQAALTAGQAQQAQDQSQLTNNVNMFNYQQQLPYQQLNQFSNLVNGQYGASTTQTAPAQSLQSVLLSDRRLKDNIKRIGTADNGLPIYTFTFKGDKSGKTHMGFMAQEVRDVHPDAVVELSSGHLGVRYDLAALPVNKEAA